MTDESDWLALETALRIVLKMAAEIERSGKAALGLRPVPVCADEQTYAPEQMYLFSEPSPDDEVTIPLYSIENDELVTERVPLPPYVQRHTAPPKHVGNKTLEKLKQRKQKGVYECELIRLPEVVDGDPPYFPLMLMAANNEGFLLPPTLNKGPICDPDAMMKDFIKSLNGSYPKAIKVRTEETKALFEGFCRDANIMLAMTEDLEHIDDALDDLFDQMLNDEEEDEDIDDIDEDNLKDMAAMLAQMSISQIRRMPDFILDQILDMAEYFPPEIINKVQKAKRK